MDLTEKFSNVKQILDKQLNRQFIMIEIIKMIYFDCWNEEVWIFFFYLFLC